MMMKKVKYIVIILSLFGIFYAKNKIDSSNKSRTQMLDSLDDGTVKVIKKK